MYRKTLMALGVAVLLSGPAFAAEDVSKVPPPAPYKKVSELVPLPDFLPGIGTLYVKPDTLPAGPFLAYDRQGKLVSTIFMIPIKDFDAKMNFKDLAAPGGTVDHVSLEFNAWPSRCAGAALSYRAVACAQDARAARVQVIARLTRRSFLVAGGGLLKAAAFVSLARAAPGVVAGIHMKSDQSGAAVGFDPVGLLLEPGQTVRWVCDANVHTATAYSPRNANHSLRIPEGAKPWDWGSCCLANPSR